MVGEDVALRSKAFRELVEQVTVALADRGLAVPAPGIAEIVEQRAREVAEQMGISVTRALGYADPQKLAASIAEAAHAADLPIRPARDTVPVQVSAARLPRLTAGLAQAGRYASLNGDSDTASYAFELISDLSLMIDQPRSGQVTLERGVLIEAAAVLTRASEKVKAGEWSGCPCGSIRGQHDLDTKLVPVLAAEAARTEQMLTLA